MAIGPVGLTAVAALEPLDDAPGPLLACPLRPFPPLLGRPEFPPPGRPTAGAPPGLGRLLLAPAVRAGAPDRLLLGFDERVRVVLACVPPPPFGPPAGRDMVVPERTAGDADADRSVPVDVLVVVREVLSGTWASFVLWGTPNKNIVGWHPLKWGCQPNAALCVLY